MRQSTFYTHSTCTDHNPLVQYQPHKNTKLFVTTFCVTTVRQTEKLHIFLISPPLFCSQSTFTLHFTTKKCNYTFSDTRLSTERFSLLSN